jgi:phage FluMu gp28-like protein
MTEVLTSPKTSTPWLSFQRAWMNDESPMKLAEKSRRIGWTYVESYDAVSRRFRSENVRNMDYWFSSADESAAREFIEYCEFWTKNYGKIVKHFVEGIEDPDTKRQTTAFCIRCPNGKRITAMTSSPRRFRSKGGDITCDEFGFHDDARAMYAAAKPASIRGGWVRAFSTHNGEESLFNQFVKMAKRVLVQLGLDPNRPPTNLEFARIRDAARSLKVVPWKLHRVTLIDAVEAGLVENINHYSGTNFSREQFIEDCRSGCIDEDMWNQEYMCIPSVGTAALLTYDLIEKCESPECAAAAAGFLTPEILAVIAAAGGPCYIGMDIGQLKDPTNIWLDQRVGDVLVTRCVKYMDQAPFHAQLDVLREWMRATNARKACIDAGGIGAMLAQEAAREFGESRVEQVRFSLPIKEELAMPVRRAFEDRTVRIPGDTRIREDLHKIRKVQTAGGTLRFDAERDQAGHADAFWAKALAQRAAGNATQGWDGSGVVGSLAKDMAGSRGVGEDDDESRQARKRDLMGV